MELSAQSLKDIAKDHGKEPDDPEFVAIAREHYYSTGDINLKGELLYAELPEELIQASRAT